jgi:hypothetical protein
LPGGPLPVTCRKPPVASPVRHVVLVGSWPPALVAGSLQLAAGSW